MKDLELLLSQDILGRLGWTFVHSIWQGALIGLFALVVLIILKKYDSRTRYFVMYTALLLILITSMVTFVALPLNDIGITSESGFLSGEYNGYALGDVIVSDKSIPATGFVTGIESLVSGLNQYTPLLALFWFLGSLVFAMRFAGGLFYVQRMKNHRISPPDHSLIDSVNKLCSELNIKRVVKISESGLAGVPMVIGSFKPVILVPLGMASNVTPHHLEILLYHELMHIRRRDYLFNLVQSLIEVLFFYHPVVWWLSKEIRIEREHICDDEVLSKYDKTDYARALAITQEWELDTPELAPALASDKTLLINRIKRMMKTNYLKRGTTEGLFAVLIMIIGIFALSANAAISFGADDENLTNEQFENIDQVATTTDGYQQQAAVTFVSVEEMNDPDGVIVSERGSFVSSPDTTEMSEEEKVAAAEEMERVEKELERVRQEYEKAMEAQAEARERLKEVVEEQRQMMFEQQELMRDQMKEIIIEHKKGQPGSPSVIIKQKPGDGTDASVYVYRWNDEDGKVIIDIEDDLIIDGDSLKSFFFEFDIDSLDVMPFGRYFDENDIYVFEDFEHDFDFDIEYEFDEMEDALRDYHFQLEDREFELQKELERIKEYHWPDIRRDVYGLYHGDKTERIIRQEMIDDGLIESHGDYVIELNAKEMIINGEKQPRKVYQKYRRLFESMEDEEIDEAFKYKLIL